MSTFFDWFFAEEKKAAPMVEWLTANTPHEWQLYHSGGGCLALTTKDLRFCITDSEDASIHEDFTAAEGCAWILVEYRHDAEGEDIAFRDLGEGADLRALWSEKNDNAEWKPV